MLFRSVGLASAEQVDQLAIAQRGGGHTGQALLVHLTLQDRVGGAEIRRGAGQTGLQVPPAWLAG